MFENAKNLTPELEEKLNQYTPSQIEEALSLYEVCNKQKRQRYIEDVKKQAFRDAYDERCEYLKEAAIAFWKEKGYEWLNECHEYYREQYEKFIDEKDATLMECYELEGTLSIDSDIVNEVHRLDKIIEEYNKLFDELQDAEEELYNEKAWNN